MNLTKNFASCRQSWQDSRQDRAKIFATVNLLLGENLGEIRGRIPARFWPLGISFPGENLAGIPVRFQPGRKITVANISPRSRRVSRRDRGEIAAGSRQDPGLYFTRAEHVTALELISKNWRTQREYNINFQVNN